MKKTIILPLLAIVAVLAVAFGSSAFRNQENIKDQAVQEHYFRFDGTNNSDSQIQSIGNWVDMGVSQPELSCEEPSGVVCFVKFNGDLSAFQSYIASKTVSDLQSDGIIQAFREE